MATQTNDSLTQTTDELRGLWRESQEAATTAWQRWAESVQSFTPASFASPFPTSWNVPTGQLPNPQQSVDAAFDLAEQVLQTQRRFLHEWIDATRPVLETAQRQTGEIARRAEQNTEKAVQETQATARRAEQNTEKAVRQAQAKAKEASKPDYSAMTVEELQERAAKADIEGRSSMNKDELVKALSKR